jgi:hypothetical protein
MLALKQSSSFRFDYPTDAFMTWITMRTREGVIQSGAHHHYVKITATD